MHACVGNARFAVGAELADISGSNTMLSAGSMKAQQHCNLALQLITIKEMTAVPADAVNLQMQAEIKEQLADTLR